LATRCDAELLIWALDVRRSALSVSVQMKSSKSTIMSKSKNQEESGERFYPKKLPPPTPDRREGRLFPPEQS
jgi:hypothetical protein